MVGYDVFAVQRAIDSVDLPLIPLSKLPKTLGSDEKKIVQSLNETWKNFRQVQRKAEKVPLLRLSSAQDLSNARGILSKAQSRGARLYRALIIVTLLKAELTQADEWFQKLKESENFFCSLEAQYLMSWLMESFFWVSEGLRDLGQAYPENEPSYQRSRNDIDTARKAVFVLFPRWPEVSWCQ
jgi:hypothetical protein